jgi:hypothetical protein
MALCSRRQLYSALWRCQQQLSCENRCTVKPNANTQLLLNTTYCRHAGVCTVRTAPSPQDRLEWSAPRLDRLNLGEQGRLLNTGWDSGGATDGLYILRNNRMPCPLRESKSGSLVLAKCKGVRQERAAADCLHGASLLEKLTVPLLVKKCYYARVFSSVRVGGSVKTQLS